MFAAVRISGMDIHSGLPSSYPPIAMYARTAYHDLGYMPRREDLTPPGNSPSPARLALSECSLPPSHPGESDHQSRPERQPIFKAEGMWWLRSCSLAPVNKLFNLVRRTRPGSSYGKPGPQRTTPSPPVPEGQRQKKVNIISLPLCDRKSLIPGLVPLKRPAVYQWRAGTCL